MWSNATVLYLVRHGRTAANAAGLLLGRLDPGLDDVGRWQAERLAEALAKVLGPEPRVISSPLTRTRQTAAYLGADVEVDDRFVEVDYGVLDGVALRDVPPAVWEAWRRDTHFAPEGGESFASVFERVAEAVDGLLGEGGDADVVVVSHVLPIKAAVARALGAGVEVSWHLHLDQASITRIGSGAFGPVVRTYNDVAHLAGGPP